MLASTPPRNRLMQKLSDALKFILKLAGTQTHKQGQPGSISAKGMRNEWERQALMLEINKARQRRPVDWRRFEN